MSLVYATQSARLQTEDGASYNVIQHTPWDADDPLVKRNPGFFTATPLYVFHTTPTVPALERATAQPGEKRGYLRRTPKEEPAEGVPSAW